MEGVGHSLAMGEVTLKPLLEDARRMIAQKSKIFFWLNSAAQFCHKSYAYHDTVQSFKGLE